MKTVKINTKAWTRNTYCSDQGKCCAIGFIAKAELQREGVQNPSQVDISTRASEIHDADRLDDIPEINDGMSGQKRRNALRKAFRRAGYRLVFEN